MKISTKDFTNLKFVQQVVSARYTSLSVITDACNGNVTYVVQTELEPNPFCGSTDEVLKDFPNFKCRVERHSMELAIDYFNKIQEFAEADKLVRIVAV